MKFFLRLYRYFVSYLLTSRLVTVGALCTCSVGNPDDRVDVKDCREFCTIDSKNDSIECIATESLWNLSDSTLIFGCTAVTCVGGACQNTKIEVGIQSSVTCATGACQNAKISAGATSAVACGSTTSCTYGSCHGDTCRNASITAGVDSKITCRGDACKGASLTASASGSIQCQKGSACQTAQIVAGVDTNTTCVNTDKIGNNDKGMCWNATIMADAACHVSCSGDYTCQGIRITSGVDSVIECSGASACLDSFITTGPGSQITCNDEAQCDNSGTVTMQTISNTGPTFAPVRTTPEQNTDSPATSLTSTPSRVTLQGPLFSEPGKTATQTNSTATSSTTDLATPVASFSKRSSAFSTRLQVVTMTALAPFLA